MGNFPLIAGLDWKAAVVVALLLPGLLLLVGVVLLSLGRGRSAGRKSGGTSGEHDA